ncbi:MAG: prolyl oligopeptidase family serine peptidase, partial [Gemmatimonadota bacterium]
LPEGGERVPLLLNIHGGPAAQYGHAFFDEFQVYVGAGYGVVACNPRGSAGKGDEFVRAVAGDGWGRVDRSDIDVVVREALRRYPRLDPDRMGVMGGSYGGFLSAWLIGQEDRWRSAVVERALLVWDSFAGTSDIGATFPAEYTGADHPDGWDTWWEKSPLRLADRVRTPTLLLHAENDYRCPIEQAEQYFMALLKQGVEVEMLRFPGEGHELSRNGAPKHRVERFEAILDWHARHLQ